MDGVEVLGNLQGLAFAIAAIAAIWQWLRQRSRPAAYLAGAFGTITLVIAVVRYAPDDLTEQPWMVALILAVLAAFPWLLAAFAWSFEGPMPTWLRLAGLGVPALAAWSATIPPIVGAEGQWAPEQRAFLVVFLVLWSTLAVAMARRLWSAGGRQRPVRARMRLMSTGSVLLTMALLVAAGTTSDSAAVDMTTSALALLSMGLFVAGFSPPLPLRLWWRRSSSGQFQRMQVALISSATPEGVARAVAPMVADLLGGGAVVIDAHGQVLAAAQISDEEADGLARDVWASRPLPPDTTSFAVADAHLVVRTTPYTPVFGQDEYELVEAFSMHMRLALERAQLYRSEQTAREEAQATRRELESTLYGLSHDLKSPSLAIAGFVDLLPHAQSVEERDEMMGHIKASTAYLQQLVDALLDLSRIGRTQTEVREVDLARIISDVARRLAVEHPRATVRFVGPVTSVRMNPVRAQQALDNLARNAVLHGGREDITVTVSARLQEDRLEIGVADDGRGIPAKERERVFELFQRGSTSTGRGSGVGLGMVRRIAEAYDGTLDLLDSETGAHFVLRLPAGLAVGDGTAPDRTIPADMQGPTSTLPPASGAATGASGV